MKLKTFAVKTVMNYIDELDGYQFETYTKHLLEMMGCKNIKLTKESRDYGIDVMATFHNESLGVQCKHYSSASSISYDAVEQAVAGCAFYKLELPIICTNSTLNSHAQYGAKRCDVSVIDRDEMEYALGKIFDKKYSDKKASIINYMFPLDYFSIKGLFDNY